MGQELGRNIDFREIFDVAVARAVAEMRILGKNCISSLYFGLKFVFSVSLVAFLVFIDFQLSSVFLWFVLVVSLWLQRAMILR